MDTNNTHISDMSDYLWKDFTSHYGPRISPMKKQFYQCLKKVLYPELLDVVNELLLQTFHLTEQYLLKELARPST
jgi:hypothetical protein